MNVGIVPVRTFPAGRDRLQVMSLWDAMEREWDTDAAFVTYYTPDEESWPRLQKKHLPVIRQNKGQVLVSCLVLDYDRKPKSPWSHQCEAEEALTGILTSDVPAPTAFYSTRHGLRLIYQLEQPLPPEESERAYQSLLDLFQAQGIEMDRQTSDWTRLFFLPYVQKADVHLGDLDYIFHETLDHKLDARDLIRTAAVRTVQPLELDGDRPDSAEADAMLWRSNPINGQPSSTSFYKRAKEILGKGPDAPYLFENQAPPCKAGERDDWILRYVGRVLSRLWSKVEGLTPEQVYALLRPAVALIEPGDKDPCEALWDKVCRTWEKRHEQQEIKRASFEEKAAKMVDGFRRQCEKAGKDLQALADSVGMSEIDYMRQFLMVKPGGSGVYLMQPDGTYIAQRLEISGITNRISAMGLADIYGTYGPDDKLRSPAELFQLRGSTVSHSVGELGLKSAELRNIGETSMHMAVPTYFLKDDIQPRYVPEVDQFLRVFAGDHYERLADWIGHSLDIYGPICALSICGRAASGKSFLGSLLGACFGPGGKNGHQVLTTNWNEGLKNNPVMHIDEELPTRRAVDGLLRSYVTGGPLPITQRFQDTVTCEIYPRVIITANDLDALRAAVSSRDLGDEAHEALAVRVLHMESCGAAVPWLESIGGRSATRNWISGEALALRHFMWLYKNRKRPSPWAGNGRLLVEGERLSEELDKFRYQTDTSQLVIGAVLELLRNYNRGGSTTVWFDDQGKLWTTSSGIHTYLRQGEGRNVGIKQIGQVLQKVSHGMDRIGDGRGRGYILKPGVLRHHADEHGIECPVLDQAIKGKK